MTSALTDSATERSRVQRRILGSLAVTQVLGGISLAVGATVGALLAEDISGSATWAGLGGSFQVLGSALIAIPIARLTAAYGRRRGLTFGYAVAIIGALGMIAAGVVRNFPLLLIAATLFGGATASNSQTRYAAADLALPHRRARDLSIVVWATTIGSTLGPNLVGPAKAFAAFLGIPLLTGSFAISVVGLVLAIAALLILVRPDPLLESRRLAALDAGQNSAEAAASAPADGSVWNGLRVILARPVARLGLLALAVGHSVMVSVMVMTPLHMAHGHAELSIIGFVISMHILGMFAFAPLTGLAVDRFGGRAVAVVGSMILTTATLLASVSPIGHLSTLLIGLFLLGLGWSCTFVAGSALLTGALTPQERPAAQGAADVITGLAAAISGFLGGIIVAHLSFHALSLTSLGFALVIGIAAAFTPVDRDQG